MNDKAFEMIDVSRQYEHFSLQSISLHLDQGGIMGLIGPNGAGKSTLISILMGLVSADCGDVTVLGHRIPAFQVLAKSDIGYVSEDMRLYKNATLDWHMEFIRKVFPEKWDKQYADKLLTEFDLIPNQKMKGMSHGQRVKAGLLLILARHPRLLILDEPTTGLDPVARKEVNNQLMAVLADDSRSILFSSHNTRDVEQLSDHITFIDRGQIVNSDDKETFIEKWRRVRLTVDGKHNITMNTHIKEVVEIGQTLSLVIHDCNDQVLADLTDRGGHIQQVEYMSLEEIFVAEVETKRQRRTS
ncbi:ABC transporter ATP-binding protein [Marinicella gelatinilytica]|uniref:ABC transporter ATP-binding protein n=1 Tax=Marinicella gelatinilytica TaxID=2996017 RepID=UPI002260A6BD|nr:ABC transporter ATP-binding protein [Marinicella gelatinilytica]MCX7544185.1 ABC transporter ATP-binding protein [Marinicella gelatinilytica]